MAEDVQGPAAETGTLLTVQRTERDGVMIVSLSGELDMTTVGQAATALKEATSRATAIILDMTGLRFFSSAGLNLLLQLREDLADRPVEVHLAGDQRAVVRPLELTGLTGLFPIHVSVADALAALGR